MTTETIKSNPGQQDARYHLHPMTNPVLHAEQGPKNVVRGEGPYVFDDAGTKYLDALSGLWCASLGYSDKRVIDAMKQQLDELPYFHTFWGRSNPSATALAERLINLAPVPMARVLFQNSGSEANDAAIKLAWYAHNANGQTTKRKIISRWRGYHGTSVSAVSLSGFPFMHAHFNAPMDFSIHVTCPDEFNERYETETTDAFVRRLADELERTIEDHGADTIAAMIAEPVIGSGGVILPPEGYFEAIQPILKRNNILLIADEVICGFGRTGQLWGSSLVGMVPDMITCAKGLSSAYAPISAVLISQPVIEAIDAQGNEVGLFAHGYTTAGHPVCAAAALAAVNAYEEDDLVARCEVLGRHMLKRLTDALGEHPHVANIRGTGLMLGLSFFEDRKTRSTFPAEWNVAAWISEKVFENGVILRPGQNTIVMSPPFIISDAEADRIVDTLAEAIDAFTLAYRNGTFGQEDSGSGSAGVLA